MPRTKISARKAREYIPPYSKRRKRLKKARYAYFNRRDRVRSAPAQGYVGNAKTPARSRGMRVKDLPTYKQRYAHERFAHDITEAGSWAPVLNYMDASDYEVYTEHKLQQELQRQREAEDDAMLEWSFQSFRDLN